VFLVGVLLPIALVFKIPVRKFIAAISEPVAIAFCHDQFRVSLALSPWNGWKNLVYHVKLWLL